MNKVKSLDTKNENRILGLEKYSEIIGIDEVGRGCWAGPVYVAGYLFKKDTKSIKDVNDSKLISPIKRKYLFNKLKKDIYHIEVGSVNQINEIGIGKTIENLIDKVIKHFSEKRDSIKLPFFIIDGQFSKDFGENTKKIIKADSTYYSVAAASILAKVSRDELMMDLGITYPEYKLDKHKGYGTKLHREILSKVGP